MEVLFLARYISLDNDKTFNNKSGYGYMVHDIARSISDVGVNIDLVTHSGFTNARRIGNINVMKRSKWDLLKNIKLLYIRLSIEYFRSSRMDIKNRLRQMLFFLSIGYIEKIIKSKNYDLIHIHGLEFFSIPFILACLRTNTPFVITLHGLNFLRTDGDSLLDNNKKLEKEFIKLSAPKNVPMTLISTGILYRLEQYFSKIIFNNLKVIQNGTDVNKTTINGDSVAKKYNILSNEKVLICVGNISERKNQIQVVKTIAKLSKDIISNLKLLIIGDDKEAQEIRKVIEINGLEDRVFLCGSVPKEHMDEYYSIADYNITASIDEGFGLPIIEGFAHGIPTVCFSDIDAVMDLYNEDCMILAEERTDISLIKAITKTLNTCFDREYIKEYSKRFSLEVMAKKYIESYKEINVSTLTIRDVMKVIDNL